MRIFSLLLLVNCMFRLRCCLRIEVNLIVLVLVLNSVLFYYFGSRCEIKFLEKLVVLSVLYVFLIDIVGKFLFIFGFCWVVVDCYMWVCWWVKSSLVRCWVCMLLLFYIVVSVFISIFDLLGFVVFLYVLMCVYLYSLCMVWLIFLGCLNRL